MIKINFSNKQIEDSFSEALNDCLQNPKNEHLAIFAIFLDFTDRPVKNKLTVCLPSGFTEKSLRDRSEYLSKEIASLSGEVFYSLKKDKK